MPIPSEGEVTKTWTIAECEVDPSVPLTVILYVPVLVELAAVTLSVDMAVPFAARLTEVGFMDAARPLGGVANNVIVPPNPAWLVIVIVKEPWLAGASVRDDGLKPTVKSGTA